MGGRSGSASARRARDAPRPIATLALVGKAPRLCAWGLGRRLRSESERVLRKAEASESGRGGQRARAVHGRITHVCRLTLGLSWLGRGSCGPLFRGAMGGGSGATRAGR